MFRQVCEHVELMFGQVCGHVEQMSSQVCGHVELMSSQVGGYVELMSGQVRGHVEMMSGQICGHVELISGQVCGHWSYCPVIYIRGERWITLCLSAHQNPQEHSQLHYVGAFRCMLVGVTCASVSLFDRRCVARFSVLAVPASLRFMTVDGCFCCVPLCVTVFLQRFIFECPFIILKLCNMQCLSACFFAACCFLVPPVAGLTGTVLSNACFVVTTSSACCPFPTDWRARIIYKFRMYRYLG